MIFKPHEIERLNLYVLSVFKRNKSVNIEIITEKKTLSQNAYLWLIFTHVAQETGSTKKEMYLYWLNKFPKFKDINFKSEIIPVLITLSEFTKEQTKQFIDEVCTDARQEGFDIPDPENIKTLIMYNEYKMKGII